MEVSTEAVKRWARFLAARGDDDRTWLIEFYRPMVESGMRSFRNVRRQDQDDLRGAGYLGLVTSVDQWNPERMPWLEFGRFRIRAAMVDHIRAAGWVPKSVRSAARKVDLIEEKVASRLGREATVTELAAEMNVTTEQMEETLSVLRGTAWTVSSLDHTPDGEGSWLEALSDPAAETPEQTTVRREDLDALELILQRLPARLRRILRWRYLDYPCRSQKWIAAELGVHESRVSQLLDDAFDQARSLHLQPGTLFPEIYREEERMTCRD